jgi:Ser/Thr protein kinase RdoA (MazF antagonist)
MRWDPDVVNTAMCGRRNAIQEPGNDVTMVDPTEVLHSLGLRARRVTPLKDDPGENANWLVDTSDGQRVVLRRYHDGARLDDLAYEHAVLRHAEEGGWVVPVPLSDLVGVDGCWYCLNRFVPGTAVRDEDLDQRRRRGRHLARLDFDLRGLAAQLGQRAGWCPQSLARSPVVDIDWDADLDRFAETQGRLATWAAAAAEDVEAALAAIGADDLPLTVVHGDFAQWNVHYDGERLAGVVDFELTHLDSRPYELAIARTYRSPEAIEAYADELVRLGWPLSDLERAAIGPVYLAFRVGMVAWQLHAGGRDGRYDLRFIERQLVLTGTAPPQC